jgi:hypothetical protein
MGAEQTVPSEHCVVEYRRRSGDQLREPAQILGDAVLFPRHKQFHRTSRANALMRHSVNHLLYSTTLLIRFVQIAVRRTTASAPDHAQLVK